MHFPSLLSSIKHKCYRIISEYITSKSHKLFSSGEFSIINYYLSRKYNILSLILKKKLRFNFHNEVINNEIVLLSWVFKVIKKVRNFQSGKKTSMSATGNRQSKESD